ncbi:MAG: inositol-1-monophosphatase [Gammaproteobacteria bacterium]|nr:inositol-1-monophosphatase [Gammaproteobacteria bacterium]
MHPMLNIAVRAARQAGNVILRSVDRIDTLTIASKSRNDFVSEVDRNAEQEIIAVIRKHYTNHGILAEESGEQAGEEYVWIIDPLDGTTNFLHGFPQFSVSIGIQHKGVLTHAVVYDPMRQEIFTATRGAGAQLNSKRIRVSKLKSLDGALLGTGFPFRYQQHLDCYLQTFKALTPMTAGIRRAGSAALDLAYVAAGRLDGFWEFGLSPWDVAAGVLLIQEAGGLVGDLSGGNEYMDTGNIVAGSPKVFKSLLQTLHPHLTKELSR